MTDLELQLKYKTLITYVKWYQYLAKQDQAQNTSV